MAINKAKRSVHPSKVVPRGNNQERRTTPLTNQKSPITNRKLLLFPRVRGKVVKEVEFFVDPSHNCLSLRFQDNTSLNFDFATSFATEAYFSRWKAGNERVLHYWPRFQSEPVF